MTIHSLIALDYTPQLTGQMIQWINTPDLSTEQLIRQSLQTQK